MELYQIRSFLAVADYLHFRRAAKHLNLSQPALSMHLRSLEEEIGVQLVKRNRQETSLTYAGSVFRDEARTLLERAERATDRARRAAKGTVDLLRIGFISTAAAAHVLPPLISQFRKAHPGVELALQNLLTVDQISMLNESRLDIGFFRLPVTSHPLIETIRIHKERLVLLLPESHPLAQRRIVHLADLKHSPFVVYSRDHAPGYHDFVMRILNNAGLNPPIAQQAGEMYTLVSLVSAGLGVALAPVSTQRYRLPGVVVKHIPRLPYAEIALGYRRDTVSAIGRVFINMAVQMQKTGRWND